MNQKLHDMVEGWTIYKVPEWVWCAAIGAMWVAAILVYWLAGE
jgi:hypothetical protein